MIVLIAFVNSQGSVPSHDVRIETMKSGSKIEYLDSARLFGGVLVISTTKVVTYEDEFNAIEIVMRGRPDVISRMILNARPAGIKDGYNIDDVISFASDLGKAAKKLKDKLSSE